LALALHDALRAPPVHGVTARVRFTNKLIDSSAVQGSDPLLSGATGRLWAAPGGRFRLELQGDNGDAQIVSDGHAVTAYDPALKAAYRFTLPTGGPADRSTGKRDNVPGVRQIEDELGRIAGRLSLSAAQPSDVAGAPAYTVRVVPSHAGGLLSSAVVAWDAANGVPLRLAVYAVGNDTPVLELAATDISFGSVAASTFSITPPPDVKVTTLGRSGPNAVVASPARRRDHESAPVSGLGRVRAAVPFSLSAPAQLDGLVLTGARRVEVGGAPGALITYGKGLGGLAVLESAAHGGASTLAAPKGHDQAGLSLPTVSVAGGRAQVLPTALGTVVRFTRGGVQYVVAGSLRQAAVESAARGL
jgi:outer membrane lipoprotein-sorting protein